MNKLKKGSLLFIILQNIGFASSIPNDVKYVRLSDLFIPEDSEMSQPMMNSGGRFTVTNSGGTVRFIQTFFYSDTSCSTLLSSSASIVDNVTGYTFTAGSSFQLNPSSVYQLAFNRGITASSIKCMKVFMTGSNESSNGISCQSFTDMTCSGTSCSSAQTKSVTWASNPTSCATQSLYIGTGTSSANSGVKQYTIGSSDGSLTYSSSLLLGVSASGRGVVINNGYAYSSSGTNGTSTVYLSSVGSSGSLTSTGTTYTAFAAPQSVALNGAYAYVANNNGGTGSTVSQCSVAADTSGTLSNCSTVLSAATLGSPISGARDIAINRGYLYLVGPTTGAIKCAVSSSTGSLSGCAYQTGTGAPSGQGIAIRDGFAYITNFSQTQAYACPLDSNGAISTCSLTGGNLSGPRGIRINNGYAYIANGSGNSVTICSVSGGIFPACNVTTPAGLGALNTPWGVGVF